MGAKQQNKLSRQAGSTHQLPAAAIQLACFCSTARSKSTLAPVKFSTLRGPLYTVKVGCGKQRHTTGTPAAARGTDQLCHHWDGFQIYQQSAVGYALRSSTAAAA
jgi:hypothetical protein